MDAPRRYTEAEIAAILKQAARDQEDDRSGASHDGLTLAEIKEAGQAAGIAPEFIARAAATVDVDALTPPPQVYLGQRISVAHAVALPGPFTDADWDVLVRDLRHTFNAHGTVSQSGAARRWSNGNLRVYVEPTAGGHRLRFRTRNAGLQQRLAGGLGLVLMSVFVAAVLLIDGDAGMASALGMGGLLALVAAGLYGSGAYQLPRWRAERAQQMRDVGRRALDRAMERADGTATPASRAGSSEGASSKPEPTLNLDDLPDQEASASNAEQRSGRETA